MWWRRGRAGPWALAGVDLRKDRIVVYSWSKTKDGFWVTNGSFDLLDHDCGDAQLGSAALRMLDSSLCGARTPNFRRRPSPFAPVLDALGLRTWSGYARIVRHVAVEREEGTVTVTPSRNGGSKEGFVALTDLGVSFDRPEAASLGAAIRRALAEAF